MVYWFTPCDLKVKLKTSNIIMVGENGEIPPRVYSHINFPLQWRFSELDGISNHRRIERLLNSLLRRWSNVASKFRVTGLYEGN